MNEQQQILALWASATQRGERSVLATLVEVKGSAYRRAGARMLLTQSGQSAGVLNGGCLDGDLHARAQMVLETGQAQLALYDTTSAQDIVFGLGLGCRGVVRILLEPVLNLDWMIDGARVAVGFEGESLGTRRIEDEAAGAEDERPRVQEMSMGRALVERFLAPPTLFLFGAGADAVPMQRAFELLGWNTKVVDVRAPHPERAVFLAATHHPVSLLPDLELPARTAVVLMTHNFLHDMEILRWALPSSAFYVGALGPRRRTDELLDAIERDGELPGIAPTLTQLARLFAPIGLDLGAETPEEIAFAVAAEAQKTLRGASGSSLRERVGSIHARREEA